MITPEPKRIQPAEGKEVNAEELEKHIREGENLINEENKEILFCPDVRTLNLGNPTQDVLNSKDRVEDLMKRGYNPLIPVPVKDIDEIKKEGLTPSKYENVGYYTVIGVTPGFPKKEKYVLVRIKNVNVNDIAPFITGPENVFQGRIKITRNIKPEDLEFIDPEKDEINEINNVYYLESKGPKGGPAEAREEVKERVEEVIE